MVRLFFGMLLLIATQHLFAQYTKTGAAAAADFAGLPLLRSGTQSYQFSSTDPAEDQFYDYGHWLYPDADTNAVLADIQGAGTIYRIWSTGNVGDSDRIIFYIDGKQTPTINKTFNAFHSNPPLSDKPQVGSGAGDNYLAWWSYQPISFRESIKIVRKGNFRPFYNITYHTYTDAKRVDAGNDSSYLPAMKKIWSAPAIDPKSITGNKTIKQKLAVAAKQTVTLFNKKSAGYIASLRINKYPGNKSLRLRMYWDDEHEPAVDAPVKWFFGSIDNGGDVQAIGVGTIANNGYCFFPMPFWRSAKIELYNDDSTATQQMETEITYNNQSYPEEKSGYFRAKANETEQPGKFYTCLQTRGRGHVVGMAKRMPKGGHACEGDEIYYIDNRRFPDIYGTGEEDYANNAWWHNTYNSYPTHGCIGNDCYYRMHYPDLLVYEEAIDMKFECWQNYYIASLVWYYQKDQPSLVKTDSIDIGDQKSETIHQYQNQLEWWSGSKMNRYPGKRIQTTDIKENGRTAAGEISFNVATHSNNKGVRLRVMTENKPMQAVEVWVNGKQVTEKKWSILKNTFDAGWVDADFDIPGTYTGNQEKLSIRLVPLAGKTTWTAYRYDVYSYR